MTDKLRESAPLHSLNLHSCAWEECLNPMMNLSFASMHWQRSCLQLETGALYQASFPPENLESLGSSTHGQMCPGNTALGHHICTQAGFI